jgi:malonyl-CoA O-methyltransferase
MQIQKMLQKSVADQFGKSAHNYHLKAEIQQKVGLGLAASLRPWKQILPPGPILEVGCGTGFLTNLLAAEFPGRTFEVTDASPQMLHFTKNRLEGIENGRYSILDVNELPPGEAKYALIVSSFTAQWFNDAAFGLQELSKLLLPGGLLLVAFPGNQSFPMWYECCLELGLPFTANPLPDVEEIVIKLSLEPLQIDYYENDLYQKFPSSLDFFRHLKEIGANSSKTGKTLSPKQLRLLTKYWDKKFNGQIMVKWHVVYLAAKRDSA